MASLPSCQDAFSRRYRTKTWGVSFQGAVWHRQSPGKYIWLVGPAVKSTSVSLLGGRFLKCGEILLKRHDSIFLVRTGVFVRSNTHFDNILSCLAQVNWCKTWATCSSHVTRFMTLSWLHKSEWIISVGYRHPKILIGVSDKLPLSLKMHTKKRASQT